MAVACASRSASPQEAPPPVDPVAAPPVAAPSAAATAATAALGESLSRAANHAPPPDAGAPDAAVPSCVDDGALYAADAFRDQVAALAAPALDGRASGSAGDAAARRAIADRFRCLGLTPGGDGDGYAQAFVADGQPTANVIGYLAGSDPQVGHDIVVIGAHHDHLGAGHLGANDDASGIAGLLAIAQAVRRHGAPHRTIAFVAFGGEELGMLGSAFYAAHPPAALPLDRVVYDLNLDMIGSYGAVYAMGTYAGLVATAIVKDLGRDHAGLKIATGGTGEGSDHEAFCRAGIPYVFFWTPDKRCYHQRCDTIDRLDAAHGAAIAEVAGALAERLAGTDLDLAAERAARGCTGRGMPGRHHP